MRSRLTSDDLRYRVARSMYLGGTSKREICRVLGVRWDTLVQWIAGMPEVAVKWKERELTPPPYAVGYLWPVRRR